MPNYIDRDRIRDHIRSRGVPIGDNAVKDLWAKRRGPRSVIINGRRLSTVEWVDTWIEEQANRSLERDSEQPAA